MDGKKEEHVYDLTDRQILRLEDFVRGGYRKTSISQKLKDDNFKTS